MTTAVPTVSVQVAFGATPNQSYLIFNDSGRGLFNTGTFAPDAVWTDITHDVRSLSIRRGRQRQLDRFTAGTCSVVLDNNVGNYDPNNLGAGAYVSGRAGTYLSLDGMAGDYASAPDSAAVRVTGDLDIRVRVNLSDWSAPAGNYAFVSKLTGSSFSFEFWMPATADQLRFYVSTTGADLFLASSSATGFASNTTHWVRVTRTQADGVVTFYTAPDSATEPTSWTQLGATTVLAAGSAIFAGTQELGVGGRSNNGGINLKGQIYRATLRSSIGGTIVADADFTQSTTLPTPSKTGSLFTDAYSNPWTANGTAKWLISAANATTEVLPMRRVRVLATWQGVTYPLYSGFADAWTPNWAPGRYSDQWVTLGASDGFKVLANYQSSAVAAVGAGEDTGARVTRVLNNAQWPATDRVIDVGDSTLQATTLARTALDDIYAGVDSEYGRFYMDASGNARFEHRNYRMNLVGAGVQVEFNDGSYSAPYVESTPTLIAYNSAAVTSDDVLLKNQIIAQNVGGIAQSPGDTTSQAAYLTRVYSNTSLILQTDQDASNWADGLLYIFKNPELRVDSVTFDILSLAASGSAMPFQCDISTYVNAVVNPPHGDQIVKPSFVEGVDHSITWGAAPSWKMTSHLSSALQYTGFITFAPDLITVSNTHSNLDVYAIGW